MPRHTAVLALAVAVVALAGCRQQPGAALRATGQAGNAQVVEPVDRTQVARGMAAGTAQSTGRPAIPKPAPAAGPEDPPHIISRLLLSARIALPQLERELPEDFVRIWAVQDDGKTLVRPTACQVRGEAAQGAPDGWFAVELGYFILGNPREGKLTVDIKARGFADATREVVIPSREQRAGASREDFPRRPTGPDILIKMGKVLQRFLTVTTTPGPPEPRPLSITWSGDGLRSTQAAQLPAGRGGGTAKLELDVPASARRVSIDAGPDLLPVSAEIGPEQLVKHVDLRPYGSFSVSGKVVLPDGRPAENAKVGLWAAGMAEAKRTTCRPDGSYAIHGVPAGVLTVVAGLTAHGRSEPLQLTYDGADDVSAPTLTLGLPGGLNVLVHGSEGLLGQGVRLQAFGETNGAPGQVLARQSVSATQPADKGAYIFDDLITGTWTIQVDHDGYQRATVKTTVESGKSTRVNVTMRPK